MATADQTAAATPANAVRDEAWLFGWAPPRLGFVFGWALGWAVVGALVAVAIAVAFEDTDLEPVLVLGILFAETVGLTALVSARVVFPLFSRLPYALRLGLQVLTLFSGTLFGSVAVIAVLPRFVLGSFRLVATLVLVNAALAVVVGIALHTYDSMRRQIAASYRALQDKERLERELEIAREVQQRLLPRALPEVRGLEVAAACIPAVGVGGDYYDFLALEQDHLGLVIADVSGKGIPAALLMAGLQASMRSLTHPPMPPREISRRLNDIVHDSTSDARYATFFFGVYDPDARRLTYSNAGHYPPLLVRDGQATRLDDGGMPIGIFPGAEYGEGCHDLQADDLLVLFTDGIVEAPNHAGEEFGESRLVRLLSDGADSDPQGLSRRILDELGRWSEGLPRHDDVTLVLAKVR